MSNTDNRSAALGLRPSISRWSTARRVILGAIVLAGIISTFAAVTLRMHHYDCDRVQQARRTHVYSGVGVSVQQMGDAVVVTGVFAGSPAEGHLSSGARLLAVDGQSFNAIDHWTGAIRGVPGTTVELEVEYPCGGHRTVALQRDIIRVE